MVGSDDLYGPMEVDDDLGTALDTETLADRDMVTPLASTTTPGSLGRQLTYRDLRAPEVLKSRAQCYLAFWTKGIQDLEPWAWQMTLLRRVRVRRRVGIKALLERNMTSRGRVTPTASTT